MHKWDLEILRNKLEEDANNPARLHLTMIYLLDMMILEACKSEGPNSYKPDWGDQD
jgi:hypothetical protein